MIDSITETIIQRINECISNLHREHTNTIPKHPIKDEKTFFTLSFENIIGPTISLADLKFRLMTIASDITVVNAAPS